MRMASFLKFGNKAMKTQHHLDEYRQHKEVHVYRPVRWIGYGSSLAALSFGIFALVNRSWLKAEIAGTGTYLLHNGTPVRDTTFHKLCQFIYVHGISVLGMFRARSSGFEYSAHLMFGTQLMNEKLF